MNCPTCGKDSLVNVSTDDDGPLEFHCYECNYHGDGSLEETEPKCPEGVTGVDSEGCLRDGCDHFFEIKEPGKDKYDYCGYFDVEKRFTRA